MWNLSTIDSRRYRNRLSIGVKTNFRRNGVRSTSSRPSLTAHNTVRSPRARKPFASHPSASNSRSLSRVSPMLYSNRVYAASASADVTPRLRMIRRKTRGVQPLQGPELFDPEAGREIGTEASEGSRGGDRIGET